MFSVIHIDATINLIWNVSKVGSTSLETRLGCTLEKDEHHSLLLIEYAA